MPWFGHTDNYARILDAETNYALIIGCLEEVIIAARPVKEIIKGHLGPNDEEQNQSNNCNDSIEIQSIEEKVYYTRDGP